MAYIVEQFTGDRGIQLGNEEIVRAFSFDTYWQTIRIGIHCAINATYALSNIDFRMGVCTGSAASYSTAIDALWMSLWAPTASLSIMGTPPNISQSQETGLGVSEYQRVGTTSSSFGGGTVLRATCSANPTVLRSLWFLDIIKGTVGVASITGTSFFRPSNGAGQTDATRGDFLSLMETSGTPATMTAVALTGSLPLRTAKDWNSMFVAWPRSTPTLCIYDMAVVRFS